MENLINGVRRAFKITKPRSVNRIGDIPRLGRRIHLDSVRMRVTLNPSEDLWIWLVKAGWRECTYPNDRRDYLDLPDRTIKELAKRDGLEREALYSKLMLRARKAGSK
tara:strand:- start:146 stop:469 length:324 start_codon:yes stop_codon:yes gene_type:complete